jgi:hypothetical protein
LSIEQPIYFFVFFFSHKILTEQYYYHLGNVACQLLGHHQLLDVNSRNKLYLLSTTKCTENDQRQVNQQAQRTNKKRETDAALISPPSKKPRSKKSPKTDSSDGINGHNEKIKPRKTTNNNWKLLRKKTNPVQERIPQKSSQSRQNFHNKREDIKDQSHNIIQHNQQSPQ